MGRIAAIRIVFVPASVYAMLMYSHCKVIVFRPKLNSRNQISIIYLFNIHFVFINGSNVLKTENNSILWILWKMNGKFSCLFCASFRCSSIIYVCTTNENELVILFAQ